MSVVVVVFLKKRGREWNASQRHAGGASSQVPEVFLLWLHYSSQERLSRSKEKGARWLCRGNPCRDRLLHTEPPAQCSTWILDSGASQDFCLERSLLGNMKPSTLKHVGLADRSPLHKRVGGNQIDCCSLFMQMLLGHFLTAYQRTDAKTVSTPMSVSYAQEPADRVLEDKSRYQSLVGSLLDLTRREYGCAPAEPRVCQPMQKGLGSC